MTALESRAELIKLARLLRCEVDELDYLAGMSADDLRRLREQVTEMLFDSGGAALRRLAIASKVLPAKVLAAIGERAFGPVLAARITGLLDPARAVELAETMPVAFLADVAVELDPRRAAEVISRISPRRIGEITRELVRRREYVTLGRFVGGLGDPAVIAATNEIDDAALLQVAFVLESKDRLEHLIELMGANRLERAVSAAASENLWPEVIDLLSHLSEERRRGFLTLEAVRADGVLEEIVVAAAEQETWPTLLPLVALLAPEEQRRVARAAAELDPEQLEGMRRELEAAGMTDQLVLLEEARASQPS